MTDLSGNLSNPGPIHLQQATCALPLQEMMEARILYSVFYLGPTHHHDMLINICYSMPLCPCVSLTAQWTCKGIVHCTLLHIAYFCPRCDLSLPVDDQDCLQVHCRMSCAAKESFLIGLSFALDDPDVCQDVKATAMSPPNSALHFILISSTALTST